MASRLKVLGSFLIVMLSCWSIGCGGGSGTSQDGNTVSSITITPSAVSVPLGGTQQLTATAKYSNGTMVDVTSQAKWIVSPSSIAAVNASGMLTSLSQGTGTVSATLGSTNQQIALTVNTRAVKSIQLSPSSLSIPDGESQQISATATYTDGSTGDVTTLVSWTATPTSVVSVSSSGLVQSHVKGSFTVTGTMTGVAPVSENGTVGNAVVQSVQVMPTSSSIPKGTTQTFTATAIYSDNSKQDVTAAATWQSANSSIAEVDAPGLAASEATGSTQITASYQGFVGAAALSVSSAAIKTISVSPSTATIAKGTTVQLAASAVLTDGSSQVVTSSVSWASSATSVCTVNAGGLATGVNPGSCSVTASSALVMASSAVTVTAATLGSITITPSNPSVNSGGSLQLTATGTFSDGSTQNLTSSLTYTSSQPTVAAVSSSGLLQGLAPGAATITAASGSVHVTFTVTVTAATLQGITVGVGPITLAAGLSLPLTAIGTYSDGSSQDLSATVTWSSSNSTIAAVDASGHLTGLAQGSVIITATLGTVSGTVDVTISPATIISIGLNPLSLTLAAGQTQGLTATATLTDGTTTDVTASAHWSVTNPLLATISNAPGSVGVLSALSVGGTTVSASVGSVSGSATIYVNAATLTGITVGPNGLSLPLGLSANLTATGLFSDGSTQDISSSVQWTSSNGSVTISASGVVQAILAGSATVTASMSGQSGSVSVGVSAAALDAISISPISGSLAIGLTQQLTATGTYSDGSTQDITALVHWTSSNTGILTVGSGGLILAIGEGDTTVSAALGSVSQSAPATISAAVLQSIAVTSAQSSLSLGFTLQLTATGTYSDGSTQDLTHNVTWTTASPGIALTTSAGLLSGVSVGSTEATAAFQGVTGSTTITINAATLVSISVSPVSVTLAQLLLTQQFTLTGHFSDGSTQVLTTGMHWSSSNALFATIDANGLLLALGIGNVNVTATYGGLTASVTVKIL